MATRSISHRTQAGIWTGVFLAPTLILLFIFRFVPMVASLVFSFTEYDGISEMKFTGLRNYQLLAQFDLFWIGLRNVGIFGAEMVAASVALGLIVAIMLDQQFKFRNFARTIHMTPMVISVMVIAWIFRMLFSEKWGPIPALVRFVGGPSLDVFNDPNLAMSGIALMTIWREVGYYFIISLAGLQAINRELYEAASIDGANFWQSFTRITLPLMRPIILFLTITGALSAVQLFGQVLVIAGRYGASPIPPGGPADSTQTPVLLIYQYAFRYAKAGYASTMAVGLFIVMLVITFIQARLGGLTRGTGQ